MTMANVTVYCSGQILNFCAYTWYQDILPVLLCLPSCLMTKQVNIAVIGTLD